MKLPCLLLASIGSCLELVCGCGLDLLCSAAVVIVQSADDATMHAIYHSAVTCFNALIRLDRAYCNPKADGLPSIAFRVMPASVLPQVLYIH